MNSDERQSDSPISIPIFSHTHTPIFSLHLTASLSLSLFLSQHTHSLPISFSLPLSPSVRFCCSVRSSLWRIWGRLSSCCAAPRPSWAPRRTCSTTRCRRTRARSLPPWSTTRTTRAPSTPWWVSGYCCGVDRCWFLNRKDLLVKSESNLLCDCEPWWNGEHQCGFRDITSFVIRRNAALSTQTVLLWTPLSLTFSEILYRVCWLNVFAWWFC